MATVITAQDRETIGSTDLNDALETVSGLYVSRSALGYASIYSIRGIAGGGGRTAVEAGLRIELRETSPRCSRTFPA